MNVRQCVGFKQVALWFQFPQEPFIARRQIIFIFHVDQMQPAALAIEGIDGSDNAAPVAHRGEQAGAGNGIIRHCRERPLRKISA